jgi:hypothetical protein
MAFTLTWPDVLKIAPDLSTLTTDEKAEVLENVDSQLSEDQIGETKYYLACLYYAAHLGTLVKRGANGAGGPLAGESVGGVSRQYAAFSPMGASPTLDTTAYGKQYRALLRQLKYRVGAYL